MIKKELPINGEKILLIGNRSYKNLGDELILLGTVKLLQNQNKKIYISCYDTKWMKEFLSKFVIVDNIIFLTELPKGVRSFFRFTFSKRILDFFEYFKIDTVIIGGGEILTEETKYCRFYWLLSILPCIISKKQIYFMGGIQVPKKYINKKIFTLFFNIATKFYVRDFDCINELIKYGKDKVEFFMDTSYYILDNWKINIDNIDNKDILPKNIGNKYIIANLNGKGKKYINEIINDLNNYIGKGFHILYVPVSKGHWDPDIQFYETIKKSLIKKDKINILDRENNFLGFLKTLKTAEIIISARLHLFLISEFLGCKTKVYPYQKKIIKMKQVIENMKNHIDKN